MKKTERNLLMKHKTIWIFPLSPVLLKSSPKTTSKLCAFCVESNLFAAERFHVASVSFQHSLIPSVAKTLIPVYNGVDNLLLTWNNYRCDMK